MATSRRLLKRWQSFAEHTGAPFFPTSAAAAIPMKTRKTLRRISF